MIKLTCLYYKFGSLAKDDLKLVIHTVIDSVPNTNNILPVCTWIERLPVF